MTPVLGAIGNKGVDEQATLSFTPVKIGVEAAVSVRRDYRESRAGAFPGRPGGAGKDGRFAGPRPNHAGFTATMW